MSTGDALPRAITACSRCRSRKTKCDRKFPKCTACVKADVECAALDPATGRNIPRSYVSFLEEKVAALEQELALAKLSSASLDSTSPVAPSFASFTPSAAAPRTASNTMSPSSPRTESLDSSEKALSFAKMMFSAVHSPDATSLETPVNPSSLPAGLPAYDEMKGLLNVYFTHSQPQVPIITPEEAGVHVNATYFSRSLSEDKTSHYFTHILAAIAYAKDPSDFRAEQQHASALYYLPLVFKESRLLSLEAILFLTVYGTNRPSSPGIWYTLGIASRLITDLSLHIAADTSKEQALFWSWYVLDRQICVYLSRPVGIADNVIHCPMPPLNPVSASFCALRVMQSEVQRILHHSDTLPREYTDLEEWRHVISKRLDLWNEQRPKNRAEAQGLGFNLQFLRLNYEQTRLLLHGFSSNLSITRDVVLVSSKAIVEIYRDLWLQDSVNFIWLAIHNVHIAASSYIYALLQQQDENALENIISMREIVCFMLRGMSTRCPASLQILDTYLELSADVEGRITLASPAVSSSTDSNSGISEQDLLNMISNSSKDLLWESFVGGEDFTFMDFST